jgi:hypothetical protein
MSTIGQGKLVYFYVGATLRVLIEGLHLDEDETTADDGTVTVGAYQNDATVTITELKTAAGVDVTGVSLPISLTYVAASDGDYEGDIPYTAAFAADGTEYRCLVLIVSADGDRLSVKFQGRAVYAGG